MLAPESKLIGKPVEILYSVIAYVGNPAAVA
jgi:hypothetical protein